MDRLSLAERRYLQLMPTPIQNWIEFPVRKLVVWLSDDVCPVIEDYSQRPTFREQATCHQGHRPSGTVSGGQHCSAFLDRKATAANTGTGYLRRLRLRPDWRGCFGDGALRPATRSSSLAHCTKASATASM